MAYEKKGFESNGFANETLNGTAILPLKNG
jgi:hypothetical protein